MTEKKVIPCADGKAYSMSFRNQDSLGSVSLKLSDSNGNLMADRLIPGMNAIFLSGICEIGPAATTTTTTATTATTATTNNTMPIQPDKAMQLPAGNCDPSYPDVCIASPPPDLDCGDVPYNNIQVVGSDPHEFDREGDGIGCEN